MMMSAQAVWKMARIFGPALIALVFLGLWQASLRRHERVKTDLAIARAEVRQRDTIIATDRAGYRAASVRAERLNAARIVTIEARYLASKKEADRAYTTDLARGQRLAADYIAANRVQPDATAATAAPAPGGRASAGTASQGTAIAAKPDGAGSDAVVVTSQDVEICTENSIRLVNAVGWARGLTELKR